MSARLGDTDFRVEFDWRGETAFYIEHERRATLSCIYWGGPRGSVAHQYAVWELDDDRREPMTPDDRALVLARVAARAEQNHGITLEVTGE